MKQLIERGDIDYVPAVRDLLGTNSMRYVLKAIKEKNKPNKLKIIGINLVSVDVLSFLAIFSPRNSFKKTSRIIR